MFYAIDVNVGYLVYPLPHVKVWLLFKKTNTRQMYDPIHFNIHLLA